MHNRRHMRRALLLATLLAAPALAAAQTGIPAAGTITFTNTDADPAADSINIAECGSATATVQLSWNPTVAAPAQNVNYQLYASNKDTATLVGSTATTTDCPTEAATNATNGVKVVKVGNELANLPSLVNQPFPTAQMALALVSDAVPAPCTGSGRTDIFLCMQGRSGSTNFGTARAKITLVLTRPDVSPVLAKPIQPGDGALTPTWSANGTTNTARYQVQAISILDPAHLPTAIAFDPAFDPSFSHSFDPRDTARHFSGFVSGTEGRVSGLVNGVTYAVMVTGFTAEYNPNIPSDPADVGSGTPQHVNDFFDAYKAAGGTETGGCSSGVAGPLGLALLAGALALARRRK